MTADRANFRAFGMWALAAGPAIAVLTAYCQLVTGENRVPLTVSFRWAVVTALGWVAFAAVVWSLRGFLSKRIERGEATDLVEATGAVFLAGLGVTFASTALQWSLDGFELLGPTLVQRLLRLAPILGLVALVVTAGGAAFRWRAARHNVRPAASTAQSVAASWIELPEAPRLKLRSEDLTIIRTARNYCEIPVGGRDLLIRVTAKQLEHRLAAYGFMRVHRSALVNLARITAVRPAGSGRSTLLLDDGSTLPVSRAYSKALDARLNAERPRTH